eukprot:7312516-Pyramimonas_sp.AAC.1
MPGDRGPLAQRTLQRAPPHERAALLGDPGMVPLGTAEEELARYAGGATTAGVTAGTTAGATAGASLRAAEAEALGGGLVDPDDLIVAIEVRPCRLHVPCACEGSACVACVRVCVCAMYTGALCGTWISPRHQYVAHRACSLVSWVFTTLVTSILDVCAPHVLYNTP